MVLGLFQLDGRVALVTGASRGIGQAICTALAEAGADVAVVDVLGVDETVTRIDAAGRRALPLQQDLLTLDSAAVERLVARARDHFGRLDILVNNAGIIRRAPAEQLAEQDWHDTLRVNLDAAFLLSQAAGRHFLAQGGGKIINVCSMLSFQGGSQVAAYTAAKSGLAGLTRALANEWARHGINVNAIAPGYLATEVTAALRADPARSQAILSRIPAGRWGEPADAAGAVVFLASDAAAYVQGVILPVDGGWLAW